MARSRGKRGRDTRGVEARRNASYGGGAEDDVGESLRGVGMKVKKQQWRGWAVGGLGKVVMS